MQIGNVRVPMMASLLIWVVLREILGGIRLGFIRAAKDVMIGQLQVPIVGFGRLFEIYSSNFRLPNRRRPSGATTTDDSLEKDRNMLI